MFSYRGICISFLPNPLLTFMLHAACCNYAAFQNLTSIERTSHSSDFNACRPVLDVAELWQQDKIENIKWMFTGDKQVEQETKQLVAFRDSLSAKVPAINAVMACEPAVKSNKNLHWSLIKVKGVSKDIEV